MKRLSREGTAVQKKEEMGGVSGHDAGADGGHARLTLERNADGARLATLGHEALDLHVVHLAAKHVDGVRLVARLGDQAHLGVGLAALPDGQRIRLGRGILDQLRTGCRVTIGFCTALALVFDHFNPLPLTGRYSLASSGEYRVGRENLFVN